MGGVRVGGTSGVLRPAAARGEGDRPGSWMAVAVRLPVAAGDDELVAAASSGGRSPSRDVADGVLAQRDRRGRAAPGASSGPGPVGDHHSGGRATRDVLREVLDSTCRSYSVPSHRLCLVGAGARQSPTAAAQPWSSPPTTPTSTCGASSCSCATSSPALNDLGAGGAPASTPCPRSPSTRRRSRGCRRGRAGVPAAVGRRPRGRGRGDALFPLPLGDVSAPRPEVVEVRDVLDAG